MNQTVLLQEDQVESSSQCSDFLMSSGRNTTGQPPSETLPIQPDRINKVCPGMLGRFHACFWRPALIRLLAFGLCSPHCNWHLGPGGPVISRLAYLYRRCCV